jgi:hypothetical protein
MARKLALHLDALSIESFATGAGEALPMGTVHAREALAPCTIGYLSSCNVTRHTCASFDISCRVEE